MAQPSVDRGQATSGTAERHPASRWRRWRLRSVVPSMVFVLGIATTIATVALVRQLEFEEGSARFSNDVAQAREAISRRMAVHTAILQATAGFFAARPGLTRAEFRAFVERLGIDENYPGVRGVGFSKRFPAAQLPEVVARMREQGHPNFAVSPGTARDDYHAILYLEPLDERNRAAIGFDMFTDETRRAAMAAARDQGVPVASGRVELVQEIVGPKQAGFLLYVPVYRGGNVPSTVDLRREELQGFVYSPFRADDLLNGIFGSESELDIEVFDGATLTPSSLLYASASQGAPPSAIRSRPKFSTANLVDVARRPWTIRFSSRADFDREARSMLPALLGVTGVIISAFLTWLTLMQVRARDEAVQSAHLLDIERERFRTTLGSVGEAVIATDTQGRVTFMNAAAERLTGWDAEAAHGVATTSVAQFVDEATGTRLPTPLERIAPGDSVHTTTYSTRLVRRDGDSRPVDESIAAIVDERGGLIGAVSVFRDTTERRNAEDALRRGEARKRTILESSLDCVITMDRDGRIVEFNTAAERTFGNRRESVVGKSVAETIIPPRNRADVQIALHRFFRSRTAAMRGRRIAITAMRADGSEFPVEVAIAVSVLDDGSLLCATYLRDITNERRSRIERERLLESERSARADAERASRLKDEFVATLSHELRTPLNAMLGWTHLLKRRQRDPIAVAEAIEVIERNARAQVRMVEDLLDMTRILAGKIRLDLQACDPRVVIGAAVASSEPAAHAKGIALRCEVASDVTSMTADPTRLQQIVANLLSNAIKFTPERGNVSIAVTREGTRHVIRVRDTGVGITADFLPHVFDRFRQADASTTRRFGGLGLGLSIVRYLVEMHGGQVQAESAGVNQGALFTVALPVHEDAVLLAPAADEEGAEEESTRPSLAGLRVLVVDDEADAREFARSVLSEEGATVETAASADEALERLASLVPCVLISDIGMPNRDGYDFIRAVRLLPRERGGETPAVALTAYARLEDRRRALAAGYQLHSTKPVEPLELVALVVSLERMLRNASASSHDASQQQKNTQ